MKALSLYVLFIYPSCTPKSLAIAGHRKSRIAGATGIYSTRVKPTEPSTTKVEGTKPLCDIKRDVLHLCKDMRLLTFDGNNETIVSLLITPLELTANNIEHVNVKLLFENVPL